jgi:hypothetical protein
MTALLRNVLLREAQDAISAQSAAGSLSPGRNGGYGDPETPVRCTAHALVALCHAYRETQDQAFKAAAERALSYLLAVFDSSPGCIIVRHAANKDHANGVLGQAFVIEAFHEAWRTLDRQEPRDAAIALLSRHVFDENSACWRRVTPLGESITPDVTFNHQLYFAATAAMFRRESPAVERDLQRFLDGWNRTLGVRSDGRVAHLIGGQSAPRFRLTLRGTERRRQQAAQFDKEADYHLYNGYAFALLARSGVDVRRAAGAAWPAIESFARSATVQRTLEPSQWAQPLRSGAETRVADDVYFRQAFTEQPVDLDPAARFLEFVLGPDRSASILSPDPVTQKARAYRYWRLLDTNAASSAS